MNKYLFLFFFFIIFAFYSAKGQVFASSENLGAVYEERFTQLKEQIIQGDYSEAMGALKQIILDDNLSAAEKFDLLTKNYYLFKELGKYKEAGEILELAYLIQNVSDEILQNVHEELTEFYRTTRKWTKCIETHFYYLEHVKLKPAEVKAVLFEMIEDYQKNRAFVQADRVMDEVFNLCESKADFACLYYYHAQSHFNQGSYDKAIELYKKALAEEALNADYMGITLYQLGFCHEIKHNYKEAAAYYEQALPLFRDTWVLEQRIQKLSKK